MHRFFIPSLDPGDDAAVLPKDEAEHATRVLRLGAGDAIAVFDGRGNTNAATWCWYSTYACGTLLGLSILTTRAKLKKRRGHSPRS